MPGRAGLSTAAGRAGDGASERSGGFRSEFHCQVSFQPSTEFVYQCLTDSEFSVSNQSSAIECKHGPEECIGDILILCAANLPFPPDADEVTPDTPRTPTIRSLGFATCLISEYSRIPEREFVEQCALEHGIDFHYLNECASQQEDDPGDGQHPPLSGIALLRKSALHSAELGVTTSCTVRVDESVWCVRDDGSWKDCGKDEEDSKVSSLAEEVKKRYERND